MSTGVRINHDTARGKADHVDYNAIVGRQIRQNAGQRRVIVFPTTAWTIDDANLRLVLNGGILAMPNSTAATLTLPASANVVNILNNAGYSVGSLTQGTRIVSNGGTITVSAGTNMHSHGPLATTSTCQTLTLRFFYANTSNIVVYG